MREPTTRLGKKRMKNGYRTAVSAAKVAKCSPNYLLHIEEGFASPGPELRRRLLEVYGCSKNVLDRELRTLRA